MKKIVLLTLTLCLAFLISGCSYVYDFIIANNSDGTLEIEYKWKGNLYSTPYKFQFEKFTGISFDKLKGIEDVTKEDIESAEQNNIFRIILEPKQALRIHSLSNEGNFETTIDESFHINFLSLKGNKGSIELTGDQIWFQFRRIENDYFIIYK